MSGSLRGIMASRLDARYFYFMVNLVKEKQESVSDDIKVTKIE